MNELIRKLSEQARKYASDYVADCKHYGYYMEHNEYELQFEEKFAELIVRECVRALDDKLSNPNGASMAWCDGSDLLEHFGIEE